MEYKHLIHIVNVHDKYIKYLYHYDNRVMYNKGQKRPYIGIVFEVRGHKYYAPLTSPKPKYLQMQNTEDFMRINGGKLGAINFNNMIPVRDEAVCPLDVLKVKDEKYRYLLLQQIKWFDNHDTEIINRATKLYRGYKNKKLRKSVSIRCCNFGILEKYALQYNPNYKKKYTNN